jgi:hypothetical protein
LTEGAVYVYGVLAAKDAGAISADGVAGASVRTVSDDDLAVLVSDVEGGALAAAREVRAHWRVLEEVSSAATVLPLRFGTVMESDQAVRERLIEPNAERLTGLLGELAGRVQLSVKGEYDEERLLREVVQDAPAIEAMRRRVRTLPDEAGYYERIRLGEAVAAEVDRHRAEDTDLALKRLTPLAVASRSEALGAADAAFNLAFLVEENSVDDFSAGVKALGGELGDRLRIRYVGPLPPYSFAEMDLNAGSASWA